MVRDYNKVQHMIREIRRLLFPCPARLPYYPYQVGQRGYMGYKELGFYYAQTIQKKRRYY